MVQGIFWILVDKIFRRTKFSAASQIFGTFVRQNLSYKVIVLYPGAQYKDNRSAPCPVDFRAGPTQVNQVTIALKPVKQDLVYFFQFALVVLSVSVILPDFLGVLICVAICWDLWIYP